jgi:hypothetical protein
LKENTRGLRYYHDIWLEALSTTAIQIITVGAKVFAVDVIANGNIPVLTVKRIPTLQPVVQSLYLPVGIATGWMSRFRFQAGIRDLAFLHSIHTASGLHPASYPMRTEGDIPGGKAVGREADHSPPSSAELKNGGAILPLPHTSSWRGA